MGMKLYRKLMIENTSAQQGALRITWLGTAGVFITDGKTGILIDPYVSRFGQFKILRNSPLKPNRDLIRKWTDILGRENIDAVIVTHSHFDHVADAPFIGTESTLNVGRGAGMAENKLGQLDPSHTMVFGDFSVGWRRGTPMKLCYFQVKLGRM